ncbi:hypothetical protein BDB01DRAFT_849116 [Pilobolus umbonatus]|nr:hypothetical protein BDB01DRAFT_849116 [Pilobolus umbonatus]
MKDIHQRPIDKVLNDEGYVVIDDLISPDLFTRLRDACDRAVERARKGEWKYTRLVGTQFPPWKEGTDIWGIQHVMHPQLNEPVFAEYYGSNAIQQAVCELLDTQPSQLQMELFNLLIQPSQTDYELKWHRDGISVNASEEEEEKFLSIPHNGTQWNTALYEDSCLLLVPSSHNRVRTVEERHTTLFNPTSHEMPNMIQLVLKPGQTVFYNSNILHRAIYSTKAKRATLHACMGSIQGGCHRAAQIFQHGLEWMATDMFVATLPPTLHQCYENTLKMARMAGLKSLTSDPIH